MVIESVYHLDPVSRLVLHVAKILSSTWTACPPEPTHTARCVAELVRGLNLNFPWISS